MTFRFAKQAHFRFDGQSALITGAAGAIGGAIAALLHLSGCRVALADNNSEHATAMALQLDPSGATSTFIKYDSTDAGAGLAAVDHTLRAFGRLDILVPAAGIYPERRFLEIGDADWRLVFDINLDAVFRISRSAAAQMTPGASIVHIASIAGHRGSVNHAHYAASKGAILALSRSMARELSPNIRVNVVSPGVITSPMTKELVQKVGNQLLKETPAERLGQPEDIAHAVAFLCSDAASFITGESLHVNGGLLMD